MNILGVAFLTDASAAVVREGRLVSAVSEERLNRVKMWHGVPDRAIRMSLDLAGITLDEIDVIATHGASPSAPEVGPFEQKEYAIRASSLHPNRRDAQLENLRTRLEHERMVLGTRTPEHLAEVRKLGRPVQVFAHHHVHAATAYYGSGWDDCLVLTADGWGEDASATAWHARSTTLELLARSYTFDSLGYFYGSITKALGFLPHRHEGKVLGLAAYCEDPRSYPLIASMVDYDTDSRRFIGRMENGIYAPRFENPYLKECIAEYPREDVAAATQKRLEEVVCECAHDLIGSGRRLALAGGVFANVKLNQRLRELSNVSDVFVFPNMGDGGLSVGAAWLAHVDATNRKPEPLKTMFLGPEASEVEIASALATAGLPYRRSDHVEEEVGELLAAGHVVARFDGRMEFGPRALGNRSILCQATDPSVNDWLNRRLNRSEFMPFAPATLDRDASGCYENLDSGRQPARYMAMTFACSADMRRVAPAAVHVDGTARPQVVSATDYEHLNKILNSYHRRTGRTSVINTSFNMHEEPIVCTIDDALRAFTLGGLAYLAAGPFLVATEAEAVGPVAQT